MLVPVAMLAALLGAQDVFDTPDPTDDDYRTGPEVGERIPEFQVLDADGKSWSFDTLKGTNGAVLHFYRSADW